ncbi:hypothetical protein D0B32_12955 [Paraburkholderia sp. DHOC27]|nr:hypothetical protein D0B32_12955 [Paraburkholderia sp. DHOC27]
MDDVLTVQGNVNVNLELVGELSCSLKNDIDRDTVRIGHALAERELNVSSEVLSTFEDFKNGEPELVEIEIVPTTVEVVFRGVGPYYES